jgi:hypothetical protein
MISFSLFFALVIEQRCDSLSRLKEQLADNLHGSHTAAGFYE